GIQRGRPRTHRVCLCQHVYLRQVRQTVEHDGVLPRCSGFAPVTKRILYIHGIGTIGGAERDLLAMLRALDRDTWDPHCACPPDTPLSERLAKEGIPLHSLTLGPWRKWYS